MKYSTDAEEASEVCKNSLNYDALVSARPSKGRQA